MKRHSEAVEGSWEDIVKQASRFAGCRVRVTVLREEPAEPVVADDGTRRFLEELAGSWVGDDLDECLELVYRTRSETRW